MKMSQKLKEEAAFVERSLGDSVICQTCRATLDTFADACTAGLQDPCPGYLAIEKAKTDFNSKGPQASGDRPIDGPLQSTGVVANPSDSSSRRTANAAGNRPEDALKK